MKTKTVRRDKVAKAFAAELARCPEGVTVREIDGVTGGTYRLLARRRCTPRLCCTVHKSEGYRATLRFYFVR